MKILMTGFEAFDGEKINPSWEVLKKINVNLKNVEIRKIQIPTAFKKSFEKLLEEIKNFNPDYVICLGQAGGIADIHLERVAINIDDARIPDNLGYKPEDEIIFEDGENAYFCSLPIKKILNEIKNKDIPCSVSNSAGTFVCNHLIYSILYYINKNNLNIKAGFIHVPYIEQQILEKENTSYMELEKIVLAIETTIETITKN